LLELNPANSERRIGGEIDGLLEKVLDPASCESLPIQQNFPGTFDLLEVNLRFIIYQLYWAFVPPLDPCAQPVMAPQQLEERPPEHGDAEVSLHTQCIRFKEIPVGIFLHKSPTPLLLK
jgi:hypothetical protein